ncbi:MAG: hypothetical protein WAP56_08895 [Acetivibrionales bacterium]|nr:hypothetical protein [Bacillota bacterium]HOA56149.1 hypothetical protein [Clostridiales bacterium]HQD31542.1 hypothetical protein [Clostridiales bacterium]
MSRWIQADRQPSASLSKYCSVRDPMRTLSGSMYQSVAVGDNIEKRQEWII